MKSLGVQYILTPYPRPPPRDEPPPDFAAWSTTTLGSLVFTEPDTAPPANVKKHKDVRASMFADIDAALPAIMNIQINLVAPPIETCIHGGVFDSFLAGLETPHVNLHTLLPAPFPPDLHLTDLLLGFFGFQIPVDRAAWAAQQYVETRKILPNLASEMLLSLDRPFDSYFMALSHALYLRGVVDPSEILSRFVPAASPSLLTVFRSEIASSFPILKRALKSGAEDYLDLLWLPLLEKKSELVQFIVLDWYSPRPFRRKLLKFRNPSVNSRSHLLMREIGPFHSPIVFNLTDWLNRSYPNYDVSLVSRRFGQYCQCLSNDDLVEIVCELLATLPSFVADLVRVSSIFAHLIASVSSHFPLPQFVDILWENWESAELYVTLFLELQLQKAFRYDDFWVCVRQKGYMSTRPSESLTLIANLPAVERSDWTAIRLASFLDKSCPGNSFDSDLRAIHADPFGNVALADSLPPVLKFAVGLWVLQPARNFDCAAVADFLLQSGQELLLPALLVASPAPSFAITCAPSFHRLVPVFQARSQFGEFVKFVFSSHGFLHLELQKFLRGTCGGDQTVAQYDGQAGPAASASASAISRDAVVSFCRSYSVFFDLRTYDAMHSAKDRPALAYLLSRCFASLVRSSDLPIQLFWQFFLDFANSPGIPHGMHTFVRAMISAVVTTNLSDQSSPSGWQLFTDIFFRLFSLEFISPSTCLAMADQLAPSILPFIRLIAQVIADHPASFLPNAFVSERVIAQLGPGNVQTWLEPLRNCLPPIITADLTGILDAAPASSELPCAMFSLLPAELHSADLVSAFTFYADNVSLPTAQFWTAWLKYKPFYICAFPVARNASVVHVPSEHLQGLIRLFTGLFRSAAAQPIHYHCWKQALALPGLADRVIADAVMDCANDSLKFDSVSEAILHPALFCVSEESFEILCRKLTEGYGGENLNEAARFIGIAFAVFLERFRRPANRAMRGVLCGSLLGIISRMCNGHCANLTFVIDCFNTTMTQVPRAERGELVQVITPALETVPKEARKLLITLQPPQVLGILPVSESREMEVEHSPTPGGGTGMMDDYGSHDDIGDVDDLGNPGDDSGGGGEPYFSFF
jgi:hypothetical protein